MYIFLRFFIVIACIFFALLPKIILACSVPPDILHEFRIDTQKKTLSISYSLLAWRNLHPSVREALNISDTTTPDEAIKSIQKNIIDKTNLILDGKPVHMKAGGIDILYKDKQNNPNEDMSYTYLPDEVLTVSLTSDIPFDINTKHEIRLEFDKSPLLEITPLIHPFLTTDIMQKNPSEAYVTDPSGKYYDVYKTKNANLVVRNALTEGAKINVFELFLEPQNANMKAISDDNRLFSYSTGLLQNTSVPNNNYYAFNPFRAGDSLKYFFDSKDNIFIRILGIFIAIIVGGFHALLPGHSKTLLAGYMFSQQNTKARELWTLIGSITLSHTASIGILAIIIIILGKGLSQITGWLLHFSQIVYGIFGAYFLYRGYKMWQKITQPQKLSLSKNNNCAFDCNCDLHTSNPKKNFSTTLFSGIIAGINPCIDALALFIVAISLGDAMYAFIIIIAFSLGLGLTLGLLLLFLQTTQNRIQKKSQYLAQKIIAGITMIAGIILVFFAFNTLFL